MIPAYEEATHSANSPDTGHILIVDDERINRGLLGRLLRHRGYRTTEAGGGIEALQCIAEQPVDLVLLDIAMPDMDGFSVLRRLRSANGESDLPVIMVTADKDKDQMVKAFEDGANDYVTKPVDIDVALARIRTQLKLRQAQQSLKISEQRYALAAQGANDGLWDWNLTTGDLYTSPRWREMVGLAPSPVTTTPSTWFDRIHSHDKLGVERQLSAHLCGEIPHFQAEFRMRHEDDSFRWMKCRGLVVRDQDGHAYRIAGSLTDITEGKVPDPLTSLPNRLLFRDRLERCIEACLQDETRETAVLYLDVDNFKLINDRMGHEIGDQLLIAMARRLEGCIRSQDALVARLGGDEFAVLLERLDDTSSAESVATRLVQSVAHPFSLGPRREVFTTTSVGISYVSHRHVNADDLLREADTAMYHAKSHGKSQYAVFDPTMRTQVLIRSTVVITVLH